jgi:hypothetical protein
MAAQGRRKVYSQMKFEPVFFLEVNVPSIGNFIELSINDKYNTLIQAYPILTKDNVSPMPLTYINIIIKSPNGVSLFKYTPESVGIDNGMHASIPANLPATIKAARAAQSPTQNAGSKHKSKRHTRRRKHTHH